MINKKHKQQNKNTVPLVGMFHVICTFNNLQPTHLACQLLEFYTDKFILIQSLQVNLNIICILFSMAFDQKECMVITKKATKAM